MTVRTASGSLGTFLADGTGRTLYAFAADTGPTSTCTGACASIWPPLTVNGVNGVNGVSGVNGEAAAGTGAQAGELGTTARSDGTTQVTYDGHPLYHYAGDTAAGQTRGQGINGFGARWWVVAPSGQDITSTSPAGRPAATSAGNGAYGY